MHNRVTQMIMGRLVRNRLREVITCEYYDQAVIKTSKHVRKQEYDYLFTPVHTRVENQVRSNILRYIEELKGKHE